MTYPKGSVTWGDIYDACAEKGKDEWIKFYILYEDSKQIHVWFGKLYENAILTSRILNDHLCDPGYWNHKRDYRIYRGGMFLNYFWAHAALVGRNKTNDT